ncbi:MAG: hypothetical protein M3466_19380 [Gemmatimonadota bacterium]|nr:hypothetical protein [Gemmatimonadota bacterium]
MRMRELVLYGSIVGLALGCAPKVKNPSTPTPEEEVEVLYGTASLEVVNESIFDVRVFVIRAGQFTRLGMVTSMTTGVFELGPFIIDREIRLYAEPVGSTARQRTDAVYVRPGQQIRFGLEKRMRSHSLAVY